MWKNIFCFLVKKASQFNNPLLLFVFIQYINRVLNFKNLELSLFINYKHERVNHMMLDNSINNL